MNVEDIHVGASYRTMLAVWTVEQITPAGRVYLKREDGKSVHFTMAHFAQLAEERVDPSPIEGG